MRKRRITVRGMLELINDVGEDFMPMSKKATFRKLFNDDYKFKGWENYFPFSVENTASKLVRKGWVKIEESQEGKKVIITENGNKQVLMFNLENIKIGNGEWDGKWRVVFFDILEMNRRKRDWLRKYMKKLGLKQMQKSVWVTPWEIRDEIKYIREVLQVANDVKWGVLQEVENEEDLRKWFNL